MQYEEESNTAASWIYLLLSRPAHLFCCSIQVLKFHFEGLTEIYDVVFASQYLVHTRYRVFSLCEAKRRLTLLGVSVDADEIEACF